MLCNSSNWQVDFVDDQLIYVIYTRFNDFLNLVTSGSVVVSHSEVVADLVSHDVDGREPG